MKNSRFLVLVLALWVALGLKPSLAASDEYDDSQSNPFRIAAYLMYPAAFLVEWTVFRPFHWLVSATPAQEALFGHRPHPPVIAESTPFYDYGMAKKVAVNEAVVQPKAVVQETPPEKVRIVEVPVEKIVVKEVTKVVEVPKIVEVPKVVEKVVEVEKFIFPAVAFRFDSVELTDLGKGQVYLAAQRLKQKTDIAVVIEGHTDNVGADEYNQKLGMRRAQTVMNELSALGIDRNRMSAATFGESKPAVNQETAWARAVNRRVEFQVKAQ
jgi:outer membrane protein OmpA-like peptidoglycan-associated protein